MKVDQNLFFREATLRICGSLEPDRFLGESFDYIRDYIPADQAALTHYYEDKGEHAVLAMASSKGAFVMDLRIPLPPAVQSFVTREDAQTMVVTRAETHPTAKPWISKGLIEKDSSLLISRLLAGQKVVGALVLMARGEGRFTKEHARLLSLLREPFTIALSNCVHYMELLQLKELLTEDYRHLQQDFLQSVGGEIVGSDFGLRGVMEMVRQGAPLNSPVLLLGETGTGKELIATAIHKLSRRRDGPFITVNCGAIPENLIDSELFGHEKGAFTGALSRKRGRFERANGGTIFLDEVGELKPEVQVRLLRVLQAKEIERVGGTEPIKVDIRVVAATHRDLEAMVREGKFREDLYFRIKVFPIVLPPLRERKGDIPSLVQHFVQKKAGEMGFKNIPSLTPGTFEHLMAYPWPGNIRELENAVERALILSKGKALVFTDLEGRERAECAYVSPEPTGPRSNFRTEDTLALDEMISRHIRRVLEMAAGRVGGEGGAAELLHINPSTLRKRMRKLGIPFGRKARHHYGGD
ncbi:MAG: sigma 54-interacting transcriptional regulator [Deltaproteobacteria bacterium]|nr:sigma 54-interacting transcriptional regulator [Deltaproteobacteria bacterium]